MKTNYYFGCEDPFGRNEPKEEFDNYIYPVLSKYNISESDMNVIVEHIQEMCFKAYSNGEVQESWNNADYDV